MIRRPCFTPVALCRPGPFLRPPRGLVRLRQFGSVEVPETEGIPAVRAICRAPIFQHDTIHSLLGRRNVMTHSMNAGPAQKESKGTCKGRNFRKFGLDSRKNMVPERDPGHGSQTRIGFAIPVVREILCEFPGPAQSTQTHIPPFCVHIDFAVESNWLSFRRSQCVPDHVDGIARNAFAGDYGIPLSDGTFEPVLEEREPGRFPDNVRGQFTLHLPVVRQSGLARTGIPGQKISMSGNRILGFRPLSVDLRPGIFLLCNSCCERPQILTDGALDCLRRSARTGKCRRTEP